jgi:tetratricopeptide (TPR) repeat protein
MGTTEFAKRIASSLTGDPDFLVTWFLGAGCSISSGIPTASTLTRTWLQGLHEMSTDGTISLADWAATEFPGIDLDSPSNFYGDVMERRFLTEHDQQVEVERIISGKDPSIGYALLALMAASEAFGARTNTFLTTNFDDLVADAMYLTTPKKPLVIASELLAVFARRSRRRPLVMKMHGDALLGARNTGTQTSRLPGEIGASLRPLLTNTALVFCGYSGSDRGVAKILAEAAPASFVHGLYWVGEHLSDGPLHEWLVGRDDLIHVPLDDFDLLLLEIAHNLPIELPDGKRFSSVFDTWKRSLLDHGTPGRADTAGQAAARGDFANRLEALQHLRVAYGLEEVDADKADEAYALAIAADPTNVAILGSYADFLADKRKDYDSAEKYYERAIEADPNNADNLGNYAIFLKNHRNDDDHADASYQRAIDADPNHANNLGNYAIFLAGHREDYDTAETYFRRALDADPNHANHLGNYAILLSKQREDYDAAETYYKRAIDADPHHANHLGNYATFLKRHRANYDAAETYYKRAIDADPAHAGHLGSYATFLANERHDYEAAETYYKRAMDADPEDANQRGNYAHILLIGHSEDARKRGLELAQEVAATANLRPDLAVEVNFYLAVHGNDDVAGGRLKSLLVGGARSPGWDLTGDIAKVKEIAGPSSAGFAEALALVIGGEAEIDTVEGFAQWADWEL